MDHLMKIGELSHLFGISIDTLRHYDRIGLLKPTVDPNNNYRYYSPKDITFLKIIQLGKSADFSLSQINDYISSGTVESYLEMLDQLNKNLTAKQELIESQRKYCLDRISLLSRIVNFHNDWDLTNTSKESLNINIYSIHINDLNNIEVYPRTIEENQGIKQWILYKKGYLFLTSSPEDSETHYFSYQSSETIKVFEDAIIEQVKLGKATRHHIHGTYYGVEFWGVHHELADYLNFLCEHFEISESTFLPIQYLFSLPTNDSYKHFVKIYIPCS